MGNSLSYFTKDNVTPSTSCSRSYDGSHFTSTEVKVSINIKEENNDSKRNDEQNSSIYVGNILESLDYTTFLTLIRRGKIEGKDLIYLSNTSRKLKEYCNRSFQIKNSEGKIVETISQYLFFILLKDRGIRIIPGQNLREIYKQRVIGGKVWSFVYNCYGQLGLGDNKNRSTPTLIPHLNNIVQMSAGGYHSLILDNKGRVWTCGTGRYGRLGLGDENNRFNPTLIPNLSNIAQVSAGDQYSLVLDSQGQGWGFGNNYSGQLGLGDATNRNIPTLISNLENVIEICAGEAHSLALDNQGRVWGFGSNYNRQSGLDGNENRLVPTLIHN